MTSLKPSLLGAPRRLRTDVEKAAENGLVVLRYVTDECRAEFEVVKSCSYATTYTYEGAAAVRSIVMRAPDDISTTLPLAVEMVRDAFNQRGGLRLDAHVVGRRVASAGISSTRAELVGSDCDRATHVVRGFEVGGASLVAGPNNVLNGKRDFFARPATKKEELRTLQLLGRKRDCTRAKKRGREEALCRDPIALDLVPVSDEAPAVAEMVKVPAGRFVMGTNRGVARPQHQVKLSSFEIDRTEVSARDYATCVAASRCTPAGTGPRCTAGAIELESHPINCVTWKQAAAFCKYAKKRLPTEAEWERAARGTDKRKFAWGNQWPPPAGAGNFADTKMATVQASWRHIGEYEDGFAHTASAEETGPSATKAIGLAGNVKEWVFDVFSRRTYFRKLKTNPRGPKRGAERVVRGASFGEAKRADLEVTRRGFYFPATQSAHIGFRCAKSTSSE